MGPAGTLSVTSAPFSIPPDLLITSTGSQGGFRRSNAPGRLCQAKASAAEAGRVEVKVRVLVMEGKGIMVCEFQHF